MTGALPVEGQRSGYVASSADKVFNRFTSEDLDRHLNSNNIYLSKSAINLLKTLGPQSAAYALFREHGPGDSSFFKRPETIKTLSDAGFKVIELAGRFGKYAILPKDEPTDANLGGKLLSYTTVPTGTSAPGPTPAPPTAAATRTSAGSGDAISNGGVVDSAVLLAALKSALHIETITLKPSVAPKLSQIQFSDLDFGGKASSEFFNFLSTDGVAGLSLDEIRVAATQLARSVANGWNLADIERSVKFERVQMNDVGTSYKSSLSSAGKTLSDAQLAADSGGAYKTAEDIANLRANFSGKYSELVTKYRGLRDNEKTDSPLRDFYQKQLDWASHMESMAVKTIDHWNDELLGMFLATIYHDKKSNESLMKAALGQFLAGSQIAKAIGSGASPVEAAPSDHPPTPAAAPGPVAGPGEGRVATPAARTGAETTGPAQGASGAGRGERRAPAAAPATVAAAADAQQKGNAEFDVLLHQFDTARMNTEFARIDYNGEISSAIFVPPRNSELFVNSSPGYFKLAPSATPDQLARLITEHKPDNPQLDQIFEHARAGLAASGSAEATAAYQDALQAQQAVITEIDALSTKYPGFRLSGEQIAKRTALKSNVSGLAEVLGPASPAAPAPPAPGAVASAAPAADIQPEWQVKGELWKQWAAMKTEYTAADKKGPASDAATDTKAFDQLQLQRLARMIEFVTAHSDFADSSVGGTVINQAQMLEHLGRIKKDIEAAAAPLPSAPADIPDAFKDPFAAYSEKESALIAARNAWNEQRNADSLKKYGAANDAALEAAITFMQLLENAAKDAWVTLELSQLGEDIATYSGNKKDYAPTAAPAPSAQVPAAPPLAPPAPQVPSAPTVVHVAAAVATPAVTTPTADLATFEAGLKTAAESGQSALISYILSDAAKGLNSDLQLAGIIGESFQNIKSQLGMEAGGTLTINDIVTAATVMKGAVTAAQTEIDECKDDSAVLSWLQDKVKSDSAKYPLEAQIHIPNGKNPFNANAEFKGTINQALTELVN